MKYTGKPYAGEIKTERVLLRIAADKVVSR